jgi:hypothetical protein
MYVYACNLLYVYSGYFGGRNLICILDVQYIIARVVFSVFISTVYRGVSTNWASSLPVTSGVTGLKKSIHFIVK